MRLAFVCILVESTVTIIIILLYYIFWSFARRVCIDEKTVCNNNTREEKKRREKRCERDYILYTFFVTLPYKTTSFACCTNLPLLYARAKISLFLQCCSCYRCVLSKTKIISYSFLSVSLVSDPLCSLSRAPASVPLAFSFLLPQSYRTWRPILSLLISG